MNEKPIWIDGTPGCTLCWGCLPEGETCEACGATRHIELTLKLKELHVMYQWFLDNGWRESQYAPRNSKNQIQVIELGSTGIHSARRDETGAFWVIDERDMWPSNPILYRKMGPVQR